MTYDDAGSGRRTARRHDRQEGCLDRPDPLPTRVEALPDLPPAYHDALDAGLLAIGVTLSGDARRTIDDHVRLLLAWTSRINLTAIRDPVQIAIRHVVDSLTALAPLGAIGSRSLLDLGSGGGFPGVPLLAALPGTRAVLVESVGKKARFLETVLAATGLDASVSVAPTRAEDLARTPGAPRAAAVVARAVASLADLVELGLPLVVPNGVVIAWKSGWPGDASGLGGELAAADRALLGIAGGSDAGAGIEVGPAVADLVAGGGRAATEAVAAIADHRLVFIRRGHGRIDAGWPRDPAVRRRRPW